MTRNPLVPAGAWDTHTHVFDPEKFPYSNSRSYTPKAAQVTEYPVKTTGCTCVVIVHASIQGSSPSALLDTLSKAQSSGLTLRGLATIDIDNTTDAELDALHAAGGMYRSSYFFDTSICRSSNMSQNTPHATSPLESVNLYWKTILIFQSTWGPLARDVLGSRRPGWRLANWEEGRCASRAIWASWMGHWGVL